MSLPNPPTFLSEEAAARAHAVENFYVPTRRTNAIITQLENAFRLQRPGSPGRYTIVQAQSKFGKGAAIKQFVAMHPTAEVSGTWSMPVVKVSMPKGDSMMELLLAMKKEMKLEVY